MPEKNLRALIDTFLEENKENILQDIRTLVAIPSLQSEALPDAPFGKESKRVLEKALEIAQGMGLSTRNCENYLGYAEVKGQGDRPENDYIATIAHLDIVPEGNGWKGDPFVVREVDGWLIGRGVEDNKSPAVLSLYAAKFFQQHWPLQRTLRALLGTQEETGMKDMDHYLKNYPAPAFAFTPDGGFPVCHGEKGGFGAKFLSKKIEDGNVKEFEGGVASNVVPDKAWAVVKSAKKAADMPDAEGLAFSDAEEGYVRIDAAGKGGHASSPKGTINAIGRIVDYLLAQKMLAPSETPYFGFLKKVFASTDGSTLGIDSDDGKFDPLTAVGGVMRFADGVFSQTLDVRYPTSTDGEKLAAILKPQLEEADSILEVTRASDPFYIEPDSDAIRTLVETYADISGDKESKPFLMGGGTYARKFPHAVSYGIGMKGDAGILPAFVGGAHAAEEGVKIETLWLCLRIFIEAIAKLDALPSLEKK